MAISLAYNSGRILSYGIGGAIAGALGVMIDRIPFFFGAQLTLRFFAGLLLCAVGLYVSGLWSRGAMLERIGLPLWKRIEPHARRLFPVRTIRSALALGSLWGWMPCGLVYAALGIALATGSPWIGGATMIAFGVGTLPAMLAMGVFGVRLGAFARRRIVRRLAGVAILGFGLFHVVAAGAQVAAPRAHACCLAKHP